MYSVIGLGKCGCNIAREFSKYSQYKIFMIDSDKYDEINNNCSFFQLKKYNNPELYEKNVPRLKNFFGNINGEVLFIVGGSGIISGASLAILEQIKKHVSINVLYIKPDNDFLNKNEKLQEKITFKIFQEYARSGLFENLFIVSNNLLENIVIDYTISNYFNKINEMIVSIFHWYNILENNEAIINNFSDKVLTAKINTFGISNLEKNIEHVFFQLDNSREKRYYYIINNKTIKSNKEILLKIKQYIKIKKQENKELNISFSIFDTEYDNYSFFVERTSFIQKE